MTTTERPEAGINSHTVVTKPWGREVIFAAYEGLYVGKLIFVHPGQSLSCQVHHEKTETQLVIEGMAIAEYGPDPDHLERVELYPGESIHLPAGVVHRITAGGLPLTFTEVSTAYHGWETDITRFSDAYGREGTTNQ